MKKYLSTILFATFCFVAAHAQQFGDWEIVCWDSAGVTVPLQVRVSTANSTGALIRTYYRFTPGGLAKAVPTTGTIGACGVSQLENVVDSLHSVINLLGDCSGLSDEWRVTSITANTTYNANTFSSMAVTAISGTVTINTDGSGAVTIPTNSVYVVKGHNCTYVQTNVVVGVTGGEAHVSRFY
jgi:hypothetical protein